ncbi:MAG: NOL1/NOP2/sun family putative RNA methylase [Nanobdellota archaeon]
MDIKIKQSFKDHFSQLTDYDEFIRYCLSPLRRAIRVNTLKISVGALKERLPDGWVLEPIPWTDEGFWIKNDKGRKDVGNLDEHSLGYIYVQEPASMIPPIILDPKPGEKVLDMCASPGSKTTQIAQYMKGEGLLVSNDYKALRMRPLALNVQRTGITNCVMTLMRGHQFKKAGMVFDKVLVDAPCSGTGTIRKSLKTLDMWNENMTKKLAKEQVNLITSAYEVLKPGGTLVYSTCSVEPEENEAVISALLDKHDDAEVEPIEINMKRSEPFTEFNGKGLNGQVKNCLRIWPQDNDTEGFFVARIRKCG